MKKITISESEKRRILEMHQDATKRQYLSEQGQPQQQQGDKVEDPNAAMYGLPQYEFLLNTGVPAFFAKHNIDLQTAIKKGMKLYNNGTHFIWLDNGVRKYFPIAKNYDDNYAGSIEEFKKAEDTIKNTYNDVYKRYNLGGYGCIKTDKKTKDEKTGKPKPMRMQVFDPTAHIDPNPNSNCKQGMEKLKSVARTIPLQKLSNNADIERFIQTAPKFKA